jgi:hypothetical protein
MIIKAWRRTAVPVAFAVLLAYLPPAAVLSAASASNFPSEMAAPQDSRTDPGDDDDKMSGGELAALILLGAGAAAGILWVSPSNQGPNHQTITLTKETGNAAKVSVASTDWRSKPRRSAGMGRLDIRTGKTTVTMDDTDRAGKPTHSQWIGIADGKYYPVTGDRTADEFSFTKLDARTLEFSSRKAGRVTLTGRIVFSDNGRSFTISRDRIDSTGRRISRQATFAAR